MSSTRILGIAALLGAAVTYLPLPLRAADTPAAVAAATPAPAAGLTLERAIELALARDERAAIAGRNAAAAEARVARARAFFFPDVTVSAGYQRRSKEADDQEVNIFSATLLATVSLFDARSIPLYRQAKLARNAANLDAREAMRLLAYEAADAYIATLGQERVVAAAEQRVDFARKSLADAKGRVDAGLVSSNDATRAALELATAERELVRAHSELEAAYLQLGHLIGVTINAPLAPPEALLSAASATTGAGGAESLVSSAQTRRLDIAADVQRAHAADELAREPGMRWWPSVDLVGQAQASSLFAWDDRRSTDWFVGITATWVVWDGGERGAETEEREAQARIAELEVDAGRRQVNLEVKTALAHLARAREAVGLAQAAVDAAHKNVDETAALYKQGLARALEVADATSQLFDAEVALARDGYALGLALLDLRAALGLDPLGREPTA